MPNQVMAIGMSSAGEPLPGEVEEYLKDGLTSLFERDSRTSRPE